MNFWSLGGPQCSVRCKGPSFKYCRGCSHIISWKWPACHHLSLWSVYVLNVLQKVTRACTVSSSPMKRRGGTRQSCATPFGEAFWKSTQKVLAANTGLYNKLTGQHTDLEKTSIDLTREDTAEESDSLGTTNQE